MHTTAGSLVATAQYLKKNFLYGNQQKFNIKPANYYLPIRFEIQFERKFPIRRSLDKTQLPLCFCMQKAAICMAHRHEDVFDALPLPISRR